MKIEKIKAGDAIKVNGKWGEVLRVHPLFGISTFDNQAIDPAEIEEWKPLKITDSPTPGSWRWEFVGNAGGWYLVGNDGHGPLVRGGPGSADGALQQVAPDLMRLYDTCRANGSQLPEEVFDEFVRLQAVIEPIVRPGK